MIARPHICLRCQYRLAKRSAPLRNQVVFQSSYARSQRARAVSDDYHDEDEFHHTKRPLRLTRRPLASQKNISEHPLGKLYGYTGSQQRENREKLSIDVLGEAAEVIVLRDSKISKYTQPIEEDVETQEGVDILAKLDEERGLVGWDEVEANINDFRPEEGEKPQTNLEFSQLLKKLQRGFTVAQLARYLQAHAQVDKKAPKLSSTSLIQQISPWMPGVSESDEYLDQNQLRGYDLESYTSKQRLVLRILRECWRLELPFVEEGIGQIEVELKPGDLDLLLKGNSSALSAVYSKHIGERGEMLESFKSNGVKHSRNAIRITTTRVKSYAIVRDIEERLKNISRVQISLKDLMPAPKKGENSDFQKWMNTHFDNSVIEEVARLTKTDIQRAPGGLLSISSAEPYTNSSTNRTDIAQRLLLASYGFSNRTKNWLGCRETLNAADGVMVKYPLTEGLSWRDRLRQWTRWTIPITKEAERIDASPESIEGENNTREQLPIDSNDYDGPHTARDAQPPPISHTMMSNLSTELPSSERPESTTPTVASWKVQADFESFAIVGNVLHHHPPLSERSHGETALFANSIRSFSTSVPNLSRILTNAVASQSLPTESVLMRFLPNPFGLKSNQTSPGSEPLSAFPPIEIRFGVDSYTKALHLKSIGAILSTENSDLLLPSSPTDIRFQQRSMARLLFSRDNLPSGLANFFEESNLTLDFLKGKGGLSMPPSLTIPIASHLIEPHTPVFLGPRAKDVEVHDVEYLFAGLEIRKTLPMEFEGWRLLYTSIEAGKAGGRRGELQLRPRRVHRHEDPSAETEDAFLESAFKLADGSFTPTEIRKIMRNPVRMVPSSGVNARPVNKIFKFFAHRPLDSQGVGGEDEAMEGLEEK